jgi:choline-sulfatase
MINHALQRAHGFLRRLGLTIWMSLAIGMLAAGSLVAAQQPNILFIFADDQCYETIHALGNEEIETPNLDRLVREGTVFTHAYNMGAWHGAVCVASRTSLNTGRTVWRARALENSLNEELKAGRFWGQLLQQAGYETYMTGKWHVKADAAKAFNHTIHVRPGMPRTVPEAYQRPVEGQPDVWLPWDAQHGGFWEGGMHWSEVLASDANTFLNQAKSSDRPFFMYLAFNAPHDPRQSPKAFVDTYPLDRISLPPNYLPVYPFMEDIGCGKDLRDERLAPWPRTPHAVTVHRREYYALITHMDAQIGKILEGLEASGRLENTTIFFTADHGLAVGHHGLFGKQNMYEHSMRPPLILAGPNIPKGRRIETPVYLQDIMPTSLELAGATIPDFVEFKSLLPLIRGDREQQYDAIYGAYREKLQRMIIKGDFKLIHYPAINRYRLYNLKTDPLEMADLAGEAEYQGTVDALRKDLRVLQAAMADPLLTAGTR